MTLPNVLRLRAASHPEAVPLLEDGARALSYAHWDRWSAAAAREMVEEGLRPDDRVALLFASGEWIEYAIAYIAIHRAGGVAVHLNDEMDEAEIRRRLEQCAVAGIAHSSSTSVPDFFQGWTFVRSRPGSALEVNLRDGAPCGLADIRYTSGTTGLAKPYAVPHSNLTFGRTLVGMDDFGQSGAMLVPMPVGTSTGATVLTMALTTSAQLVVCDPADTEAMGRLIEAHAIEAVMLNPAVARRLAASDLASRHDLSSISTFASAGAPLRPRQAARILALSPGACLKLACAQSEASPAIITGDFDPEEPFRIGRPTPLTDVRIATPDGSPCAPGEVGELWLRSDAPERTYLDRHPSNNEIEAPGWYRTGDLVSRSADGQISFFDRAVDVLWRDGRRLSSLQIEFELDRVDGIEDVAVVAGVSASSGNESIVAWVVPTPGVDRRELVSLARQHPMADGAVDQVVVVDELPLGPTGKVLKRVLRAWSVPVCDGSRAQN